MAIIYGIVSTQIQHSAINTYQQKFTNLDHLDGFYRK